MSQKIVFMVQGSAPTPYTTTFMKTQDNLSAHCTCPAGEIGQYCKHRLRILKGSTERIVSGNQDEVQIVQSWVLGSDVEKAIKEIEEAERAHETTKAKLALSKKKLARALMN